MRQKKTTVYRSGFSAGDTLPQRKLYGWAWDTDHETMCVIEMLFDDEGLCFSQRIILDPNEVPEAVRFIFIKQVWLERDDGQMVRLRTPPA